MQYVSKKEPRHAVSEFSEYQAKKLKSKMLITRDMLQLVRVKYEEKCRKLKHSLAAINAFDEDTITVDSIISQYDNDIRELERKNSISSLIVF